jgi:UDP-3-O-[3-hydroxymyristoyl] glucosamine N-acyltransferase
MLLAIGELANRVQVGQLIGDPQTSICGAAPLSQAGHQQVTLLDNPRHLEALRNSAAAAVVVSQVYPDLAQVQLVVEKPRVTFDALFDILHPRREPADLGRHPTACIDPSARLGQQVQIGAAVSIGRDCTIGDGCILHPGVHLMDGCRLGDNCQLFPGVVLYPDTILESRVLVHAASVLGAYGFGYQQQQGQHIRTSQRGWVHVESDVEIGAGVTIDRGSYGATRIGTGTKIDNQVMIGHNCQIGRHNLICSQVGLAGSCTTGDYVVLAGQVGIKDHTTLGDRLIVAAQSGVMHNLEGNQVVQGSPAIPAKAEMQRIALMQRLPQMRQSIKELERTVAQLVAKLSTDEAAGKAEAGNPPSANPQSANPQSANPQSANPQSANPGRQAA